MSERSIGYYCAHCSHYNLYRPPVADGRVYCESCSQEVAVADPSPPAGDEPLEECPHCGNAELYLRKDFPQQLGCAAVTATIVLSSIAYAYGGFLPSLIVLGVASLADWILYRRLDEITVCYRCHAELRGFTLNPRHGPFDLSRAEEYEHGR